MNRYLLTLMILTCVNYTLRGQDSLSSETCKNFKINYTMTKHYSSYIRTYEMGGHQLSTCQLAERLNLFPESANEYRLAKKSIKAAIISFAVGVPLVIAGNIYGYKQNVSTGALIAGSIVLVYAIQIPGFKAIRHHRRSLNLYNSKVCGH